MLVSPYSIRSGRLALLAAACLALTACAGGSPAPEEPPSPAPSAAGPIAVVAATDVFGDIVKAVGGDRVEVTSIIDNPSADPEGYTATPADATAVSRARLVISNGEGYDAFMAQLVQAAGGQRAVIEATAVSGLGAAVAVAEVEEFNEHVWFSLPSVQKLSTRIAAELGQISPADAARFTANAQVFNQQVDGLIRTVGAIRAQHQGARVAATEPLPLYLLADAGLVDATPDEFMEASEEGTDAPAAVVQETLSLLQPGSDRARVLILNTQTQTAATDQLTQAATAAFAPVVQMNETLPEGSAGYLAWMNDQINALGDALNQTR